MSSLQIFRILTLVAFISLALPSNRSFCEEVTSLVGTESNVRSGISASIPTVKGRTFSIENSDRILHRENGVGFARSADIGLIRYYGVDATQITGTAEWLHYTGAKALLSADLQPLEQLRFATSVGAAQLTLKDFFGKSYDTSTAMPLWRHRTTYSAVPGTEVRVEGNNDFSFVGWLDPGNHSRVMAMQNVFGEVESFSFPHWQLRTNFREGFYGDSNEQQVFDNLVVRDVIELPFVVKAGFGGGWNAFGQQLPYWSPSHLNNYGLRLVASKEFSKAFNIETRFSYGYHQEPGGPPPGKESSAEVHLQYNHRSGLMVKLDGNFLDSENGAWWRRDFGVNAEMPF